MGLKSRIIIFVMLFGVGAGGSLTLFNQLTLEKSLLEIQQQQVKASFDLGTLNLNTTIERMENSAKNLAHFSAEVYHLKQDYPSIDTDTIFQTNLFNTFSILKQSIGGGVWFEPYKLDPNIRWYGPYIYREEGELIHTWDLSSESYNFHEHSWYKEIFIPENLNENGVYWSEPYFDDAGTNSLMVTVTAPIFDKDKEIVGVATVDWAIKHLRKELLNMEFTTNSSAFLIDRESGLFLSFPDAPSSEFRPASMYEWSGKLIESPRFDQINRIEGIYYEEREGTIFFISATSNLVLGIFLPDSDYLKFINEVTSRNLKFSISISLFFLVVLILLLNRLFAPFSQIMNAIKTSINIDEATNSIKVTAIKEGKEKEFYSITKALNQVYEEINKHAERLSQTNIELIEKQQEINELNTHLEEKVQARTCELERKTLEVVKVLESLREAQEQMILMEKNAALGQLVAGVAHEVNTPIGVCITATSVLLESYEGFAHALTENKVTRNQLDKFVDKVSNTLELLVANLERTDKLIESFKQVSIDQLNEDAREYNLAKYMELIVAPLSPLLEKSGIKLEIQIPNYLTVFSYPGAMSQIINNLVTNSVQHAFNGIKDKQILISAEKVIGQPEFSIEYRDNGIGMEKRIKDKVFEPFFTTKRGAGGIGLGMHITFNLITQKLKGVIELESAAGKGTTVKITIPEQVETN